MHAELISEEKVALNESRKTEIKKETLTKVLDSFLTHFNIIMENVWLALACFISNFRIPVL